MVGSSPRTYAEIKAFLQDSLVKIPEPVSHSDLLESSKAMIGRVFPDWKPEELSFFQCKDGITNKLMRCTWTRGNASLVVLIRAYGKKSEIIIDRERELIVIHPFLFV